MAEAAGIEGPTSVASSPGRSERSRLVRWQALTLGLMTLGYTGYYLCRSDLSVATPLIIEEFSRGGLDPGLAKIRLGGVVTAGILAYAVGKLAGGAAGDFLGGRGNILIGMLGAVVFTLLFALGGSIPIFTLAWSGNRLVQAIGWPGMVKVASRWFPSRSYGTVMGLLSLSYLWGDSLNRAFLGFLLDRGFGWRPLFAVAAGIMAVLLVLSLIFLKESPGELGLIESPAPRDNVFGRDGEDPRPTNLAALIAPFLRSREFLLVCLLSFALTLVRESFNTWSVTYFREAVRLESGSAARMSALFPLFGGVSVLIVGFLGDRLGRGGRPAIMLVGLVLATAALAALGTLDPLGSRALPIAVVSIVALLVIGPYSYLAGAMALDLGGKRGGATASGLIDFVGYLGGALSGAAIASVSVDYGWRGVFRVLAVVSLAAALGSFALLILQTRTPRKSAPELDLL